MGKGGQVVGREGGLIRDGQSHQLRFASLATLSQGEWPVRQMTLGNMRANGVRSLDLSCWRS